MIDETPIEYLRQAAKQIQRDIDWYSVPNRKGTNYTDEYRAERIAKLESLLKRYETAIALLSENEDMQVVIQTKQYDHGHQVLQTDPFYISMTEEQQDIFTQILESSDTVIAFNIPERKS